MGVQLATENASLQTESPPETVAQLACEKSSQKDKHAPELFNWLDASRHQSDSDSRTPVRTEDAAVNSDSTCNLEAFLFEMLSNKSQKMNSTRQ